MNRTVTILAALALTALVSCSKGDQGIASGLGNDCINRYYYVPYIAGTEMEFAYAMFMPKGSGRIDEAEVACSMPGAPGTFLDNNAYDVDEYGQDRPHRMGGPCVEEGGKYTVTFDVDTVAATLRFHYIIPEEAKGKQIRFHFKVKAGTQVATFDTPEYYVRKMDMKLDIPITKSSCYFSMETMEAYSAEELIYDTRLQLCRLFGGGNTEPDPKNVVFTKNITESLNILIKGLLRPGDHVLVSSMEHNAVMRPLRQLEKQGVRFTRSPCAADGSMDPELVSRCELEGLNAGIIFRGRTPEKIAALYLESLEENDGVPPTVKEREARTKEHPLTAEQLYMVDYQLYTPNSTMYNLYSMMKLDKELIDMEKMAAVLGEVIARHPALLTRFSWNKDRELVQSYHPEQREEIRVEHLTEFEFRYVRDTLVYPFKIVGGRLYRCRVFETEKAGYVFFDVHHSVFDGTSLKVFMRDIGKSFLGAEPEPDFYYLMLQRREEMANSPFYEESRRYFEQRYDGVAWSCYPKIDHESRENEMGELFAPLGILQPQMNAMERAYKISRNEFFITVAALAISLYNDAPDVKISWIYNGREDLQNMTTVGLLFRDLPVGLRLKDSDTLRNVFADVHEQVQKGIEHSCYPYVDSQNQVGNGECAYLLYQQDIRDMGSLEGFDVETVEIRQNQAASQTILDMEILDGEGGLTLMIDFAASRYKEESMEHFKDIFVKIAQSLVTHNAQTDVSIREIREKLENKKNFFRIIAGIFRRKK